MLQYHRPRSFLPAAALGLLVAIAYGFFGCKTTGTEESDPSALGEGEGYAITYYEPGTFGDRCPAPAGLDSSHGFAPAEGLFGVKCTDNWKDVPNPESVQDVEDGDIRDAQKKGKKVNSKLDYLKLAFELCGGTCVKKNGNRYQINIPQCGKICSDRTFSMTTSKNKSKTIKVFIESACPARHWKNLAKAKMGVDNNPCATPNHVDLSTGLKGEVGDQESTRVFIKEGGGSSGQTKNPQGQYDNPQGQNNSPQGQGNNARSQGNSQRQGNNSQGQEQFPTCQFPENDGNKDGWGWENGKSCKVDAGQNQGQQQPASEDPFDNFDY